MTDSQKPQLDKFKKAARQLETDDDPDRFKERVGKLVKHIRRHGATRSARRASGKGRSSCCFCVRPLPLGRVRPRFTTWPTTGSGILRLAYSISIHLVDGRLGSIEPAFLCRVSSHRS